MGWDPYILQSTVTGRYYVGQSEDAHRRLPYHNSESKGFTQRYRPWKIVYCHQFESKEDAIAAEKLVKGWKSKKMIRYLVEGKIDIRDYLK